MLKPRVLIIDPLSQDAQNIISEKLQLDYFPNIDEDKILSIIDTYDSLILRSGHVVTEKWIKLAKNIKLIIRAGVGIDNIPVKYLQNTEINFYNIPTASTRSVAEFAVLSSLNLLRNLYPALLDVENGLWNKSKFIGNDLTNKVVGFIGFGRIGKEIYSILQSFRIQKFYYCSFKSNYSFENLYRVNLEKIASECDVIFIQTPLNETTYKLINQNFLRMMKENSFLINVSRFDVIDMEALHQEIKKGKIGGVLVDPLEKKHMEISKKFHSYPVFFTPHIAGSTFQAQERLALSILDIFKKEKLI